MLASFDSAEACQQHYLKAVTEARKMARTLKDNPMADAFAVAVEGARCIATDDPRLKP